MGKYNFSGNGFGFIPEVRLYLSPLNVVSGSPEGIFIGGYVPLRYVNGTFKVKDNLSAFVSSGYNPSGYVEAKSEKLLTGFGGMIGYHLILAKIISLEFILGLAYTNGYLDEKYHVKFKPDDANATTQAQSDLAVAISNPNGYNSSTGTFEYTIPDAAKTFSQFIPRFGINLGIGF